MRVADFFFCQLSYPQVTGSVFVWRRAFDAIELCALSSSGHPAKHYCSASRPILVGVRSSSGCLAAHGRFSGLLQGLWVCFPLKKGCSSSWFRLLRSRISRFFLSELKFFSPHVSILFKGKWMQLVAPFFQLFSGKIWFVFRICSIFATANEKRTASRKKLTRARVAEEGRR